MIVPVRCFSCGKVVADAYEKYAQAIREHKPADKALDEIGLTRYCCRRMIASHSDVMDQFLQYNNI